MTAIATEGADAGAELLPPTVPPLDGGAASPWRVEVITLFEDAILDVLHLGPPAVGADHFTIGPAEDADFPLARTGLPSARFPLLHWEGGVPSLRLGAGMRGELEEARRVEALTAAGGEPLDDGGRGYALRGDRRARLCFDEVTLLFRAVPPPPRAHLPTRLDLDALGYVGGALLLATIFLLMCHAVPPSPRSLAADRFHVPRVISVELVPPVPPAPPPEKALAERATEGAPTSPRSARPAPAPRPKLLAPDPAVASARHGEPVAARSVAAAAARGAIDSLFRASTDSLALLRSGGALGEDAESALGSLTGLDGEVASGGSSLTGLVGRGGPGGPGDGTIGVGTLATIPGGRGPGGGTYGSRVGTLALRKPPHTIDLRERPDVKGPLDRELVRRTIRAHVAEIRYCYEQALATHPNLYGRVVVKFAIDGTGRVLSSVVEQSSLAADGGPPVAGCIANAVRRWEFPGAGGSLVMVSYPFVLQAAHE